MYSTCVTLSLCLGTYIGILRLGLGCVQYAAQRRCAVPYWRQCLIRTCCRVLQATPVSRVPCWRTCWRRSDLRFVLLPVEAGRARRLGVNVLIDAWFLGRGVVASFALEVWQRRLVVRPGAGVWEQSVGHHINKSPALQVHRIQVLFRISGSCSRSL